MKYRILSPKVGEVGTIWEPNVYRNVGILLANGLIEQVDPAKEAAENTPTETPKPAKTKQKKAPQE